MIKTLIVTITFLFIFTLAFVALKSFTRTEKFQPDVETFRNLSLKDQVVFLDQIAVNMGVSELNDFIKLAYPDEPSIKHELAHKLGAIAVEKEGVSGFGSCTPLLQFGCFHGAALGAVRLQGNKPGLAGELWEGCKKTAESSGICLHGLGHAVMMTKQYDLIAAYQECGNLLSDPRDSFWCEDGVSMENISRSMASAELGQYGKKDDIYYPCNTVPDRFEASCVRNHAVHLYGLWDDNFDKTIGYCQSFVNENTIIQCVNNIGSIMASKHSDDMDLVINQCKLAGKYQQSCILGAVVYLSMSGQFEQARRLCNTSIEAEKETCFSNMNYFLNLNEPNEK